MVKKHHLVVISLFVIYIIGMTALMIWEGIGIAPDRYALILLLGSLLVKRTRSFLLDWMPFLLILIAYDFLRGLAPFVNNRVHFFELIWADETLFHTLPTAYLQKIFFNPNHLGFIDYYSTIFYFLHFALPLGFAFVLWLYNKSHFREFTITILLMSYAAWVSYVIYPAAPPWMAQERGYITGVTKILDQTLDFFPDRSGLPTIYHNFNPNPVAAMPSMHAAYPMLVFLFALSFFGIRALFFLPYVLSVWFSIVYLGEHYVIDVVGGVIYALAFFVLIKFVVRQAGRWDFRAKIFSKLGKLAKTG